MVSTRSSSKKLIDDEKFTSILGGIIRAKYYPDLEELEGLYADEGSASRQAQTGRSTASMTNSVRVNSCSNDKIPKNLEQTNDIKKHKSMSLKSFFDNYENEDNVSFNALAERSQLVHQAKHPHVYGLPAVSSGNPNNTASRDQQGFGAKNSMFFLPEPIIPPQDNTNGFKVPKKLSRSKRPMVVPENTRFSREFLALQQHRNSSLTSFRTPVSDLDKLSVDSLICKRPFYPMLDDPTPSTFRDNDDDDDENTPRLEPENLEHISPISCSGNMRFKVQDLSKGEKLARHTQNSRRNHRSNNNSDSPTTPASNSSRSAGKKQNSSLRLEDLSPAARRIASSHFNLSSNHLQSPRARKSHRKTPGSSRRVSVSASKTTTTTTTTPGTTEALNVHPKRLKANQYFDFKDL